MGQTGFPFEVTIEVAFRDIDALGHVNNAVFFSYMETVRIKYVMQLDVRLYHAQRLPNSGGN